jgi:hypothetical protein
MNLLPSITEQPPLSMASSTQHEPGRAALLRRPVFWASLRRRLQIWAAQQRRPTRFMGFATRAAPRLSPWMAGCILFLACLDARGQNYRLEEYAIGSNPGQSQDGSLSLSSALGQSLVGITSSDVYVLVSGFWGRNEIFTQPEMPTLDIALSNGLTVLSWNATITGLQLQETASLEAPVWTDVKQVPITLGPIAQVTFRSPGQQRFYRLRWPSL